MKFCFKNSVSLCLVRLIEPVFRSIEYCVSGFLKTVFWLIQTHFQKFFQTFLSLSDLARQHKVFFVVFYLNFCKVFLPQGRYDYSIPPFWFIFIFSCIFFMHLGDIFRPLYFWDSWWFKACFLKLIIGFWWDIGIFMFGID